MPSTCFLRTMNMKGNAKLPTSNNLTQKNANREKNMYPGGTSAATRVHPKPAIKEPVKQDDGAKLLRNTNKVTMAVGPYTVVRQSKNRIRRRKSCGNLSRFRRSTVGIPTKADEEHTQPADWEKDRLSTNCRNSAEYQYRHRLGHNFPHQKCGPNFSQSTPDVSGIGHQHSNRYHVFSFKQVQRLDELMQTQCTISPRPLSWDCFLTYPTSLCLEECPYCYRQMHSSMMNGCVSNLLPEGSHQRKTHCAGEMATTAIDQQPVKQTWLRQDRHSFSEQPQCLPVIYVQLKQLVRTLRDRLTEEQIPVREIRLNGGAAGCVIKSVDEDEFVDLDLVFSVDLSSANAFAKIKTIVLSSVAQFLADTVASGKLIYNCTRNCCYSPPLKTKTATKSEPPPSCSSSTTVNSSSDSAAANGAQITNTLLMPNGTHSYSNRNHGFDDHSPNTIPVTSAFPSPRSLVNKPSSVIRINPTEKRVQEPSLPSTRLHKPEFLSPTLLTPCSFCDTTPHLSCPVWSSVLQEENIIKQYIQKMVRIHKPSSKTADSWSLFSLGYRTAEGGKTVDLKFVDRMQRQFEFTVDSFQIVLDSLLTFYDTSRQAMDENFYPTVVAESVSGSFSEALSHLQDRIIVTPRPEEIRGGGLLKYCKLLVEGYRPSDDTDVISMERYMCSRFFIDFPDIISQHHRLSYYLANHFENNESAKATYLQIYYGTSYFPKQLYLLSDSTDISSPSSAPPNDESPKPQSAQQPATANVTTADHAENAQALQPLGDNQVSLSKKTSKSSKKSGSNTSNLEGSKSMNSGLPETSKQKDKENDAPEESKANSADSSFPKPAENDRKLEGQSYTGNCVDNSIIKGNDGNAPPSMVINGKSPSVNSQVISPEECDSFLADPNSACSYTNKMYYIPQLVTYFPAAADYSSSLKYGECITNANGIASEADYQTVYAEPLISRSLPHCHAGIILPPIETAETGEMNHYVGVPCSTTQYPYTNYVGSSYGFEPEYNYPSPVYYFPQESNYYVYTDPATQTSPAVLLAYPM
ncbi:unnamed protein product [Calicophoron daubneyi]|uniref:polynucleotide adenylyltransferase n=1 Tax=Calicophoron daubneyi TaxID=300641 RepID=A0AAV2TN26_CALDB